LPVLVSLISVSIDPSNCHTTRLSMALSVNGVCDLVRRRLRTNHSNHREALFSPTPLGLHAKESNNSFGDVSRRVVVDIVS